MRKRINNILFIVGVVAVIVMLLTFDISFSQLWQHILSTGYWLPCAIALWLMLYMMNALSWSIIIHSDGQVKVGYWHILRLTVSGFALNYVTPVGLLGGEPYRIMELSRRIGTERATSSVVLFSMMHIFSHFWYWLTAIVVFCVLVAVHLTSTTMLINVFMVLWTAFCLAAIYLFCAGYRRGMVMGCVKAVGRLPGLRRTVSRFIASQGHRLLAIDSQIAALHAQNKRAFFLSLALEYLGRICQSFEIFFILLLLGYGGDGSPATLGLLFVESFLILAFTSLFANMLAFIPLQLGGREGGFAMSVSQLGMTGGAGLFVGIFCRVREMVWIIIGLLLMRLPNDAEDAEVGEA